jgi:hypothetical protein
VNVFGTELQLKARHAGTGSRWRTDLSWKIRKGCQVVAKNSAGLGELVAGDLHPIAGVSSESDDDPLQLLKG